jgi:hypothetical protein
LHQLQRPAVALQHCQCRLETDPFLPALGGQFCIGTDNAYRSCPSLGREEGARTIAFPSVSTGAYDYPQGQAAAVALMTVRTYLEEHPGSFEEVRFVLFGQRALAAYEAELRAFLKESDT